MPPDYKIEFLLSARLFMSPRLAGKRLYFISDMGGRLSLYGMDAIGSVPEPLLPRDLALQNPVLNDGEPFFVFSQLGKILVMIDHDGDENYQPMFIPLDGGIPEAVFGDRFLRQQVVLLGCDAERSLAVFRLDRRDDPRIQFYLVDLESKTLTDVGCSSYAGDFVGHTQDYGKLVIPDSYTAGDTVLYLWQRQQPDWQLLYGVPLERRQPGEQVPLNSIHAPHFTLDAKRLLCITSLFNDHYGLALLPVEAPQEIKEVTITGTEHRGIGGLDDLRHLDGNRYLLEYNIDGVSWAYEGTFDEEALCMRIERTLCGKGALANGVLQSIQYDKGSDAYALSFATATSPSQLFTITGPERLPQQVTREKILGIPQHILAAGEDTSYTSHDGLHVSARLYLPAPELGFEGPRPVIFYVHGGPQSQERPDFTWFSMPLIQFLTLNGLAVWVPNVRGSHGYGLDYMKRVDRDWGGLDRLDHVAAWHHLSADPRLDVSRAGVVGRSYGGYMTLTLAGRHPGLWKAAVDMFGPYNLLTFIARLPEAWKTYFHLAVGDPAKDRDFLIERSPSTYLNQLSCPMLVIQGRNDPRVVEAESDDLVKNLRAQGKEIDYLVFENEGHDVIKLENKIRCYDAIVRFFSDQLRP